MIKDMQFGEIENVNGGIRGWVGGYIFGKVVDAVIEHYEENPEDGEALLTDKTMMM